MHHPRPNAGFQFTVKTIVMVAAIVAGLASLMRLDWVSVIAGATLLFAILLFSEEIWPWLRD